MPKLKAMGWKPQFPDYRDEAFLYQPRKGLVLPPKVDLRAKFENITVYDQGSLGSCTAQAAAGALLFNDTYDKDEPVVKPSRLFIYYNTRRIEGTINEDSGAMIRDVIKALVKWGYPPEGMWPHTLREFKTKPLQTCYSEALKERINSYHPVRGQYINELKACLAEGFPIIFGFSCYSSMFQAKVNQSGVIPMPKRGDALEGGHAVLAVGYDDTTQQVIFRNSWGLKWGSRGYGFLPYSYITNRNLASDFWTIRFNV